MKSVTAGGGLIYREDSGNLEVVLIYRGGVWDLPKGKREKEESVEQCALREVREETGLKNSLHIVMPLNRTFHTYEREGTRYAKTTFWFAMQIPGPSSPSFHPQAEEDIERVEWVSLAEAKKRVGYNNLLTVLQRLEQETGAG